MGILNKVASGINRFGDELLNPTNGFAKFGAYLGAASGGALGEATLASMADRRKQGEDQIERQVQQAKLQDLLNPRPGNDYERIVSRLGQAAGDNYLTQLSAGPPMAVDAIDPTTGETVRQYIPRNQLPGIAPVQPKTAPAGVTFTPLSGGAPSQGGATFR